MHPKLLVARLLALLADPVLHLRDLRLPRHRIPTLDLRIQRPALGFLGASVIDRTALRHHDDLLRGCFGRAKLFWADGGHQVVIGPHRELAAGRRAGTGGVAIGGAAASHDALGYAGDASGRIGKHLRRGLRWQQGLKRRWLWLHSGLGR